MSPKKKHKMNILPKTAPIWSLDPRISPRSNRALVACREHTPARLQSVEFGTSHPTVGALLLPLAQKLASAEFLVPSPAILCLVAWYAPPRNRAPVVPHCSRLLGVLLLLRRLPPIRPWPTEQVDDSPCEGQPPRRHTSDLRKVKMARSAIFY